MSGSDYDPIEDELTGKEKELLYEDISQAIEEFTTACNGNYVPQKKAFRVRKGNS